jgi:hypothetical protein
MGKLELIIFGVSGFLAFNAYYDNYYIQKIKSHKKIFEVGMYIFLGFSFYLLIKRSPHRSKEMLSQASNMVKYLPVDKEAFSMVTPFLNLTGSSMPESDYREQRIMQSGGNEHLPQPMQQQQGATKRSVSETKKKWVASQQNWSCNHCNQQLPAWFEVDHKVRLEYGGSNHVDNLEALCRDCHGKKTAMEKF